jgi:hypothetical protein
LKPNRIITVAGITVALGLGLGACGSNSTPATPATHSAPEALTAQQSSAICSLVGLVGVTAAGSADPTGYAAQMVAAGLPQNISSSIPGLGNLPDMSLEQATTAVNACS